MVCSASEEWYRAAMAGTPTTEITAVDLGFEPITTHTATAFGLLRVTALLTDELERELQDSSGMGLSEMLVLIQLMLVLGYYLVLIQIGPVERPILAANFLALFLLCLSYAAFGTFASTLTQNQIVAGVITFFGLLAFLLIRLLAMGTGGVLSEIFHAISTDTHLEKLIQVPFRIPALGAQETRTYVTLLLVQSIVGEDHDGFDRLLAKAKESLKQPWLGTGLSQADIQEVDENVKDKLNSAFVLAQQIAPILAEGTKGNPRIVQGFAADRCA